MVVAGTGIVDSGWEDRGQPLPHPSAHPTAGIQQDFPSTQRLPVYFGKEAQTAPLFCCEVGVINSRWSGTLLGYFSPCYTKVEKLQQESGITEMPTFPARVSRSCLFGFSDFWAL